MTASVTQVKLEIALKSISSFTHGILKKAQCDFFRVLC